MGDTLEHIGPREIRDYPDQIRERSLDHSNVNEVHTTEHAVKVTAGGDGGNVREQATEPVERETAVAPEQPQRQEPVAPAQEQPPAPEPAS